MNKEEIIINKIKKHQANILSLEKLLVKIKNNGWTKYEEVLEGTIGSKKTKVIGKLIWNEDFVDEDTGEVVTIQREEIIKVNGIFIKGKQLY